MMEPGDFVITPAWTWHDHGHEGGEPMVWLDGLDIPIVASFNTTFREEFEEEQSPVHRPAGDSLARFGSNMLPVGYRSHSLNSPIFNYPYARTREALFRLAKAGKPDEHEGYLLRYANPVDGGWAMPTIATMMRLIPEGFETQPYRSSSPMVLVAVEGSGSISVEGKAMAIEPHDVIAVPEWSQHAISADCDLVLFSYSDRVAQEKLGLFREQRLTT
jgi:gentisate 1,2-dioxygenase